MRKHKLTDLQIKAVQTYLGTSLTAAEVAKVYLTTRLQIHRWTKKYKELGLDKAQQKK